MSKSNDNPADPFKKALAEASKVMAHDRELNVSYSVDPPGLTGDSMRLPQVSRRMTREEVLLARGTADAFALNRRYHNDSDPRALCAAGRHGARALRGDGDRALRGDGRARHARHRRQHRRQDQPRGAAARIRPGQGAVGGAAAGRGRLPDPAPRHRPRDAGGGEERDGALARLHRGAGRRHARGREGDAVRPGQLCPVCPQGDHRSRLWRPAGRRSRSARRRAGGRGPGGRRGPGRSRQPGPGRGRRGGRRRHAGAEPGRPAGRGPGAGLHGRHGRPGNGRGGRTARGRSAAGAAHAAARLRCGSRLQGLFRRQ